MTDFIKDQFRIELMRGPERTILLQVEIPAGDFSGQFPTKPFGRDPQVMLGMQVGYHLQKFLEDIKQLEDGDILYFPLELQPDRLGTFRITQAQDPEKLVLAWGHPASLTESDYDFESGPDWFQNEADFIPDAQHPPFQLSKDEVLQGLAYSIYDLNKVVRKANFSLMKKAQPPVHLSERARHLLAQGGLDPLLRPTEKQILRLFQRLEMNVPRAVWDFARFFSGWYIRPAGQSGGFTAELVRIDELKQISREDLIKWDAMGQQYFRCGKHDTIPHDFYLREDGALCAEVNGNFNAVSESFLAWVESEALVNWLGEQTEEWVTLGYLTPDDPLDVRIWLDRDPNWHLISEASDHHNQWWQHTEGLFIHTGTWFDRPEQFLAAYAPSTLSIRALEAELELAGLLPGKQREIYSWPTN